MTLRTLAVLSLALLVAGCGFHLRGAVVLAPEMRTTWVGGEVAGSPVAEEVREALTSAGAEVVAQPELARSLLELTAERVERRVSAVDAAGKATEYGLLYALDFRLLGPSGETLVAPQQVQVRRTYNFDSSNVLGASDQAERLLVEMRADAVRQMLRRVQVSLTNTGSGG